MPQRLPSPILILALVALLAPSELDAQVRRGRATRQQPAWAPITVGVRAGYDNNARGQLLGAQARLPVLRSGLVQVMPSADVTFLRGAREYQYNLEVLYVAGGRGGGAYLGAGAGYRDSVVDGTQEDPRSTFFDYSLVVGATSAVGGSLQIQFELRWIFLQDTETDFRPLPLSLGVNVPLWGRGAEGS